MSVFSPLKDTLNQKFNATPRWKKVGLAGGAAVVSLAIWPLAVAGIYGLVVWKTMQQPTTRRVLVAAMIIPAIITQVFWGKSVIATAFKPNPPTSTVVASKPSSSNPVPTSQVQGASTQTNTVTAKVLQAVSGDTLDVELDGKSQRVKLIGLQAPAMPDRTVSKAECFGPEAQIFLDSLLRGRKVNLSVDAFIGQQTAQADIERYVIMDDGTKVNQLMLEAGLAKVLDEEYEQAAAYKAYAESAKLAKKGLWLNCEKKANTPDSAANQSVNQTLQHTPTPVPTQSGAASVTPISQF